MKLYRFIFLGVIMVINNCSSMENSNSIFDEKTILNNLDSNVGIFYSQFLFMNDGYVKPINVKVHLFANEKNWAIVFEKIGYHNRNLNFFLELTYFGNCLENLDVVDGYLWNRKIQIICEEEELQKLSPKNNTTENFELITADSQIDSIRVRDTLLKVEYDTNLYSINNIHSREIFNSQNLIDFISLGRLLYLRHKSVLSANEDEIRQSIPKDLPKLMTIENWFHLDEVLPSTQLSYQTMAKIIATRDTTLWDYSLKTNTHWSNWPNAGEL